MLGEVPPRPPGHGARRPLRAEGARFGDAGGLKAAAAGGSGGAPALLDRELGELKRADPRRRRGDPDDDASLAATEGARFSPLPNVLAPTGGAAHPAAGSPSVAPAELAALAERLLTSVRVGHSRDGGALVRLRVDGRGRGDVQVELRETSEGLVALVSTADGDLKRADAWAERLGQSLRERGLALHAVEVA